MQQATGGVCRVQAELKVERATSTCGRNARGCRPVRLHGRAQNVPVQPICRDGRTTTQHVRTRTTPCLPKASSGRHSWLPT